MASHKKKILAIIVVLVVVSALSLGFALLRYQPDQTIASNVPNNSTEQTPSATTSTSTPINTFSPTQEPATTANPTATPTATPTSTLPPAQTVGGGLELTVSLEKTVFNFGEPVNVTLTLTNVSHEKVDYMYTAMNLDFLVYNSTNNLVYQYTMGKAFPMFAYIEPLAPGANVTATYVWPQTLSNTMGTAGPQVPPGTYFIVGKANFSVDDESSLYRLQTEPTQVTILSP
jgi:hypothetical protein